MKRILVAVTGPDSFGVVYTTSDTLNKLGCSIIDMDQTTVRNEYSAIMIVDKPESVGDDEVAKIIKEALRGKGFDMSVPRPRLRSGRSYRYPRRTVRSDCGRYRQQGYSDGVYQSVL